jgi:hypothetical protein
MVRRLIEGLLRAGLGGRLPVLVPDAVDDELTTASLGVPAEDLERGVGRLEDALRPV